jgi:hypothetical protein
MKTRVDYFRVVVWITAFAMSIGIWGIIISAIRPAFM